MRLTLEKIVELMGNTGDLQATVDADTQEINKACDDAFNFGTGIYRVSCDENGVSAKHISIEEWSKK